MRVMQVTKFGGPEVLVAHEASEPAAGPDQVVVDFSFARVLFLETQIRSGSAAIGFPRLRLTAAGGDRGGGGG